MKEHHESKLAIQMKLRETERDTHINRHRLRKTDKQRDCERDTHIDRHTERKTNKQRD